MHKTTVGLDVSVKHARLQLASRSVWFARAADSRQVGENPWGKV